MSLKVMKYIYIALVLILGVILGRMTSTPKETIRYVEKEIIKGYIPIHKPKFEYKGNISEIPYIYWRVDTIINNDTIKVPDTIKIFDDFLVKREYDFNVFHNQDGKLDVKTIVQFNKLQSFEYEFRPIMKEVTLHKKDKFIPFVGGGINTIGYANASGGFFYDKMGVQYQYGRNLKGGDFHGLNLLFRF